MHTAWYHMCTYQIVISLWLIVIWCASHMSATSKGSTTIAISVSPRLGSLRWDPVYTATQALLVESWSPSDAFTLMVGNRTITFDQRNTRILVCTPRMIVKSHIYLASTLWPCNAWVGYCLDWNHRLVSQPKSPQLFLAECSLIMPADW